VRIDSLGHNIAVHRLLTDQRLEQFSQQIEGATEQNVVLEKSAIGLLNQRCFAVKAGCNELLEVARPTYQETINDTFEAVHCRVDG
jgi:DNA mismatch repair protein MSH4